MGNIYIYIFIFFFFNTVEEKLEVFSALELFKADIDSYYGQHCPVLYVTILSIILSCTFPVLSVTVSV